MQSGSTKSNGVTNQKAKTPDTLQLYSPHDGQRQIHNSTARYRVAAWGRQSGKSTWAIMELLAKAWTNHNHTYWFISPTYSQALVQYRRLIGALWSCRGILIKKNQTELRVKLNTMSQIVFKSGDRPDNLRTETLHGVIIDEVRDQQSDLWPMVIRPMLATTKGWAAFISTPNGFDSFYDLSEKAKLDKLERWAFFHAPSTINPAFTYQELEEAREVLTEPQFAQEILAEFRDLGKGKTYVNYSDKNVSELCPFTKDGVLSPYLPIVVAMDFNLSPMSWSLCQFRNEDIYVFDEIYLESSHTQEITKELIERVAHHKPGIILVGDATSKAGQRAAAGQSDYDIICQMLDRAGIKYVNQTPDSNPAIKDRVNNVNAKLFSAAGTIHLWHHPRCKHLRKDLQRVSWKEGAATTLDQTTDRALTHMSDGLGYAICALSPIPSRFQPGRLRIIQR